MKISKKIKWAGAAFLYILIIFGLSFRNPGPLRYSLARQILTNLAHIPLYAGLGYLLVIYFKHLKIGKLAYFYVIMLGMVIGCFDEFLQSFVPFRSVSQGDLLLDLTGICTGLLVFNFVRFSKFKKRQN